METTEIVKSIPPSAKLILKLLSEKKILRFEELKESTSFSKRTLLYAIKTLKEMDLVETQICMNDARRRFYCIKLR